MSTITTDAQAGMQPLPPPADEYIPVVQDCRVSRGDARLAASDRVRALGLETGFEHGSRWDAANSRFVIYPLPFSPPAEPWDDEKNYPERRHPDWKRTPSKRATLDELLIAVAGLSGRQWISATDYPTDPAGFVRNLQAALDLQYGRGHFWASRHGHRISVQCRYPVSLPSS